MFRTLLSLTVRALLVTALLDIFEHHASLHSPNTIFLPHMRLHAWWHYALSRDYAEMVPSTQGQLINAILWSVAVPLGLAVAFSIFDRIRDSLTTVQCGTRVVLHMSVAWFSITCTCLFFVIISNIFDVIILDIDALPGAALAFASIEHGCYWLQKKIKFA